MAPTTRAISLEALEARLLFSAELAAGLDPRQGEESAPGTGFVSHELDVDLAPGTSVSAVANEPAPQALDVDALGGLLESAATGPELMFIDAGIPDLDALLADLDAQRMLGRDIDVHVIETTQSGVDRISDTLQGQRGISAIHIVSHGSDGAVLLGSERLDAASLDRFAATIAAWGDAVSDDADLLFYGCDLAATPYGASLIDAIADLTGADVAASDDLTGSALRGGDWALEYTTGAIDADVAFSVSGQNAWQSVLATVTVTTPVDVRDGVTTSVAELLANPGSDGLISLREAVAAVNATSGEHVVLLSGERYQLDSELVVSGNLRLEGVGFANTTVDGDRATRLFSVLDGSDFQLSNLTLKDGQTAGDGGVFNIADGATVSIVDSVVSGGRAREGGGIYNAGDLTLERVAVIDNRASDDGGGIFNAPVTGSLTAQHVTFAQNAAERGGGLRNEGVALLENATVSENMARKQGAGVFADSDGALTIRNTIISNNSGQPAQHANLFGPLYASEGVNAFWDLTGSNGPPGASSVTVGQFVEDGTSLPHFVLNNAAPGLDLGVTQVTSAAPNNAPTTTDINFTTLYFEGNSRIFIQPIVVLDTDAGDEITATLTLSRPEAGVLTTSTGNNETFDAGAGVWSVTGPVERVNAALAALEFERAAGDNRDTRIAVNIRDAAGAGPPEGTINLQLLSFGSAPVATNMSQSHDYIEGDAVVEFDDIVVTDADLIPVITATLRLSDPQAGVLTTSLGSASYDNDSGVWSVVGSEAKVNAALAAVSFLPSENHDRNATITVRVVDLAGTGPDDGLIRLDVTPVNDAPSATNTSRVVAYVEGASSVSLDGIVVSDVDTGEAVTATLTLANPAHGSLSSGSAGGSYDGASGRWTMTGSVADVNAALAAVAFAPVADLDVDSTIEIRITDHAGTDPILGTLTLNVTPVNDAPSATNTSRVVSYTEGAASVSLDGIVVSDVDTGEAVTATLTLANPAHGSLSSGSAGGSYDGASGRWTMTGSVADVNAALAAVAFAPVADLDVDSTIEIRITDHAGTDPILGTLTLNVTPVNDAPVLAATGPSAPGFVIDGAPVGIADTVRVTDIDNVNVQAATIAITTNYVPGEDRLLYVDATGIAGRFDVATGVLSLTGAAPMEDYQRAIASVRFASTGSVTDAEARSIIVTVTDGRDESNSASVSFAVLPAPATPDDDTTETIVDVVLPPVPPTAPPDPIEVPDEAPAEPQAPPAVQVNTSPIQTPPVDLGQLLTSRAASGLADDGDGSDDTSDTTDEEPPAAEPPVEVAPFRLDDAVSDDSRESPAATDGSAEAVADASDSARPAPAAAVSTLNPALLARLQLLLATLDAPDEGPSRSLAAADAPVSAERLEAFGRELDDLRESVRSEAFSTDAAVGASVVLSSGLSIGYVVWILRGGMLLGSLLSSMPAWRMADPLPILSNFNSNEESDEDESLQSIAANQPVRATDEVSPA